MTIAAAIQSQEMTKTEARLQFRLTVNQGEPAEDSDEVEVYIRIPGDASGNDSVGAEDVDLYAQGDPSADFNGDGLVDVNDLDILVANFGRQRTVE